eukprot:TRINITY_DN4419_c0_g1_i4.p1 TRINITY_DN4419_c0_g1~~TRINITY_DN4419_c0_g1_i4.p1  ORF type:complete len:796 (+),score=205.82 TRINITY_DN4419_c0_g1_i4:57-2444(+)
MRPLFFLLFLISVVQCIQFSAKPTGESEVFVLFGDNLSPTFQQRIKNHLDRFSSQFDFKYVDPAGSTTSNSTTTWFLSFGNTKYTPISSSDTTPEFFRVSKSRISILNTFSYLGDGNKLNNREKYSIGAEYATYSILEDLGFGFLHPLKASVPVTLKFEEKEEKREEKPRWEFRMWHLHTMHPLEVTDFLNGMAYNISLDQKDWEKMIPEWESVLEWLVANRQNSVEWILLKADEWKEFAESSIRQNRLKQIVDLSHQYGIQVGFDIPIANAQQHGWNMITGSEKNMQDQYNKIKWLLDWLNVTGYDFLDTESGYSEFTHPDDIKMLAWMNYVTQYNTGTLKKPTFIKVHCSTGQFCKNYKNPWDGTPLNFNWLPIYADKELGILPHTVQYYSFDDPTGGSYGNNNFSYIYDLLTREIGQRKVVYYGETAYWVNYDIDVPLFLPIYARSRLFDMRKIAKFEESVGRRMHGTCNFDSGWEWGYWFQDVITARGAWNPYIELSEEDALKELMKPFTRILGNAGDSASSLILDYIYMEKKLLIEGGLPSSSSPKDYFKRNGQAYLQGWDTWSDITCGLGLGCTQPNRLGIEGVRNPLSNPSYKSVRPILQEMSEKFPIATNKFKQLTPLVSKDGLELWSEIVDAAEMTSLRALQSFYLYEYASTWWKAFPSTRKQLLQKAKAIVVNATSVVQRREKNYRVPVERIAGWRVGPTAYLYGYLWTVHRLYYFVRDVKKAGLYTGALSPCFMNIINPVDVGIGQGFAVNVTQLAREYLEKKGLGDLIGDCLAAPKSEPIIKR